MRGGIISAQLGHPLIMALVVLQPCVAPWLDTRPAEASEPDTYRLPPLAEMFHPDRECEDVLLAA